MTENTGEVVVKEEPFFTLVGNVTGMASVKVRVEFLKLMKWNCRMSQV